MKDLGKALAESAQRGQHAQIVALNSDLMTATYDKATAYLNAVTLGGYAAFFGLWSLLGSDIAPKQKFWSGLLIGISVLLFVGFEVLKVAVFHWQIRSMMKLSNTPYEPPVQQLLKRQADLEQANKKMLKIAVRVWCFVFPATILTGMGGALVLLYAFALKLWSL